jgi:hypothetical protein
MSLPYRRAKPRAMIIASSITVYGVSYAEGDVDYPSFPVDETVDANPMNMDCLYSSGATMRPMRKI